MPNGAFLSLRLPPDDAAWLASHPGLSAQSALRALAADGRRRGVRLTLDDDQQVIITAAAAGAS